MLHPSNLVKRPALRVDIRSKYNPILGGRFILSEVIDCHSFSYIPERAKRLTIVWGWGRYLVMNLFFRPLYVAIELRNQPKLAHLRPRIQKQ